ncbi:MAG: serine/threonine-protein kinase [Synechococcales bacterium]|nr:serine/threonine-protein kinase [Synechococcales bacterium]
MDSISLGGRYRIVSQLGTGGFSRTFLVQDLHLPNHPRCVIKQLKPQTMEPQSLEMARRLFDTEAQVLYKLGSHGQIPTLLAHFEENQEFYLAQEYVEGRQLSWELSKKKPRSEAKTIQLLVEILEVLAFVHQQQVIHRDIKPSNLIRRYRDGKIVLIDFGAVKQVSKQKTDSDTDITNLTVAIGTQGYMPNEQLAGKPRFSSDVYAVGMIGLRSLTGIHPKRLRDDTDTGEIDWKRYAPEVSPEFAAALDCMVRYDFRDRYPTAVEALTALRDIPIPPCDESDLTEMEPSLQETMLEMIPSGGLSGGVGSGSTSGPYRDFSSSLADGYVSPASFDPTISLTADDGPSFPSSEQSAPAKPSVWRSPVLITAMLAFGALLGSSAVFLRADLLSAWQSEADARPEMLRPISTIGVSRLPAMVQAFLSPEEQTKRAIREGDRQFGQKNYAEALKLYEQALSLQSDRPEAHLGRCNSLNALGQSNEAIVACNDALAYRPDYPEAIRGRGNAFEAQERLLEALRFYEQAVRLDPQLADAWLDQGRVLQQFGRSVEAIRALDRAIALNRNLVEAWTVKGYAQWNLGRYDAAIESLDKALQIDPAYQDAVDLRQTAQDRFGR